MGTIVLVITIICSQPQFVTLKQNNQVVWKGSYTEAVADEKWVKKIKHMLSTGEAVLLVESKKGQCL